MHLSNFHLPSVSSSCTWVSLSFILPQAAVIFPSNYFLFYSAPRLTMMDHRLKRTFSLQSVCVGLTQAHILFLPQTSGPWKDCVPLCFSHSNMIHFVFIFFCPRHFFVIYGWGTSQRHKCRLCQSYANRIMVQEGVEALANPKNGEFLNWFQCKNVLNDDDINHTTVVKYCIFKCF